MGRSTSQEQVLSEKRTYRKFSAQQKSELVLASLRGQKTIAELCREHEISETLLRRWREQFLVAGAERLSGKAERTEADELRRQVRALERALGRKTLEVEVAGGTLAGLGVSMRVARSRELVAQGRPAAVVARVAGVSRQAIYSQRKRGVVVDLATDDAVGEPGEGDVARSFESVTGGK